ncbi:MAG: undecaprenyl-diphosphate phosphatase [Nitriliruptorales bacterium]|nr:undecaprenyl-diphosphate phosphatase [Nitriliruptorales bacterium]
MLQTIVLGLVQGLTEFLPVSSSGHLVVIPYLLSWPQPPLAFDVALHFGTLLAVVWYFAADLWYLATRSVGAGVVADGEAARARRTIGLLAVASVPAAVVGYVFEGFFEGLFEQSVRPVAAFLLLTALLLYAAEYLRRRRAAAALGTEPSELPAHQEALDVGRGEDTTGWLDSIVMGLAQALAIFPGISRSGATIAAGMLRGISREGAARFSFLMSIPVIFGASLFKLPDLLGDDTTRLYSNAEIAVGVLAAALSGYWAIRFLLRLVSSEDLTGFARYVVLFAIVTFVGSLWLGPVSQVQ